ncbi:MAG: protein kinase [Thermoanaerobaculia bacterium]|nr:protein kinase [Thermoanaerobaculia bacterium]
MMYFQLVQIGGQGMKGVVWRAKDHLGRDIALKLTPADEYQDHSLVDELTKASALSTRLFAQILFFGEVLGPEDIPPSMGIATEWVQGTSIQTFSEERVLTVDEYIVLAEGLLAGLSELRNRNLVHDDLHPGNILVVEVVDELVRDPRLGIKIIDTGTVKRTETRQKLLHSLSRRIHDLKEAAPECESLKEHQDRWNWKRVDDHLRIVESLLIMANSLLRNSWRSSSEDRRFLDNLEPFFFQLTDADLSRRLDDPLRTLDELKAIRRTSKNSGTTEQSSTLQSPFDYISAEMIRGNREFAELFSEECPWLEDCKALEPLYIYGPRGCGKSSVLRWLSFKSAVADPHRKEPLENMREVGIYLSCSVELRSRFWLLPNDLLMSLETELVEFFSLLLLEELFDTLTLMSELEQQSEFSFGLHPEKQRDLANWWRQRLALKDGDLRVQGQSYVTYLRDMVRKMKWKTWARIRQGESGTSNVDGMLVTDVCRYLGAEIDYFASRHVTFLLDDYSNQRIPLELQKKLNQAISFAKQGTPIFKVSSEYGGVDLEGIQEGREVVEINIGERYTTAKGVGPEFLIDIVNRRLQRAQFQARIEDLLGSSAYAGGMASALASAAKSREKFHYYGIDTIHALCSGDLALALEVIHRIFKAGSVTSTSTDCVPRNLQDKSIQQFSAEEVERIRYVVPDGRELASIVDQLGTLARAFLVNKQSTRDDRKGAPVCKTHIDIRSSVVAELEKSSAILYRRYRTLTDRAILFSLETSRSRIEGKTERLQLRRIYFPIFLAPVKRDTPIKIDNLDGLKSLLTDPKTFVIRELRRGDLNEKQLNLAWEETIDARRSIGDLDN